MSAADGAIYTPFTAPYRMTMGLMALDPGEWLEIDDDLVADLAEKRRLLDAHHDRVFVEQTGSRPAQQELQDLLVDHLIRHYPALYRRDGDALAIVPLGESLDLNAGDLAPLDRAGRLVQEDLCLMQRDEAAWRLTAASVCFPTRWDLMSKLGQPLDVIHDPVPGFRERMAGAVARFFDHLSVERPVWRLNWSLIDDPALFQPAGHGRTARNAEIDAQNAGDKVWLRVERQTLRRLPATSAVVFTIRIHRWPLKRLAARPEAAATLKAAIETMPAEMQRYKSMPALGEAVLGYLARLDVPDDAAGADRSSAAR